MTTILLYLIAGTVSGYLLDRMVTSIDVEDKFTFGESLWAITLWPLLLLICAYSFLQGLMESLKED